MEFNRNYIYPSEIMYHDHPPPYISPSQSKYHNIGMNSYTTPGDYYPYKRPGFWGDYGPRQEGLNQTLKHGVYPLDPQSPICYSGIEGGNTKKTNISQISRYVQPLNKYPKF